MTAKFRSHIFCGSLHERRIEIPCVFRTNIPATHTAYASFFVGVMGISFVDCSDRTAVCTNSAGSTAGVRLRFERNVGVFLICPVVSGKVQRTINTAFKLGSDLAGKCCQLFCLVHIRKPVANSRQIECSATAATAATQTKPQLSRVSCNSVKVPPTPGCRKHNSGSLSLH